MNILNLIKDSKAVKALSKNTNGDFVVQDPLGLAFTVASSFQNNPRRICVVAPNLYEAQNIYELIASLIGEENVLFYPLDEVIRIDTVSSSKEMLSQRLFVMSESLKNKNQILITHTSAALRKLPPKEIYVDNTLIFKVDERYNLSDLINKLSYIGFLRVSKVDTPLQFALRGDILDIYPVNASHPYRIEFFDDVIESIRELDIASQRSQDEIDEFTVFPSTELLYDKSKFENIKKAVVDEASEEATSLDYENRTKLLNKVSADLFRLEENGFDDNLYPYFQYAYKDASTILDYFYDDTRILYNYEKLQKHFEFFINEVQTYFEELFQNGLSIKKVSYFDTIAKLYKDNTIKTHPFASNENDFELPIRSALSAPNILKSLDLIKQYLEENKKVLVCLDDLALKTYEDFLKMQEIPYVFCLDNKIEAHIINLNNTPFQEGFELVDQDIVVLTKKELMGYKSYSSRYMARYKKAEILSSYEDLKPGDYVVHEENGIGQFVGIETLDVGVGPKDFLKIQYALKDVLYVPLEQFTLIRKFVGQEGAVPHISRLGSGEWKKTKKRIKDRVNDIADRLIALYSHRMSLGGFAFEKDDEFQNAFEMAFPYPLTSDQKRCVEEIKEDMQKPLPMDRLLCGDVGFGKTEVAFRAAFKAILSHKQVMLLCPTTLLARQHYDVAVTRFATFGVNIAIFSRFIPLSQQKRQIEQIKQGNIQLIIGTHRLLSHDIEVPSLGLLIVDEEQRFGVEHKERIKELSQNIDVLTLTATPIPRTLQMSLLNIRSLSTINSAPINRMPIQTYVMPYQESLIVSVIERELSREGQVFYLHNRVASIYAKARKIQSSIKNAKVGVIHGKMEKDDVDEIMEAYYQGVINVLVCTSIIETGLDIPNANTIIIENANHFGLAQLYQIKGRVGRSTRVAYAYLLYNPEKEMNDKAEKRLKAIKDFTELGSGYKIAQRDLNIRGAGDILGAEQSGFVDTVGMDMYLRILREVIEEKQGKIEEKKIVKPLHLSLSGYIPSNYAEDSDKIQIYQEIEDTNTIVDLNRLRRKIRDIYGRLPKEVEALLRKRKIDILADSIYIESVEEREVVVVTLTTEVNKIPSFATKLNQKLFAIKDRLSAHLEQGKLAIVVIKGKTLYEDLETILEAIESLTAGD